MTPDEGPAPGADPAAAALGRTETRRDRIDAWRAGALHAALDLDGPAPEDGDALPAFHHWIYFLEARPAHALGRDGHPARGGFIPDLGLPRRMWAGGALRFHRPLRMGAAATRRTTIDAATRKTGRSGPLAFVSLRHEISCDLEGEEGNGAAPWIEERQDIVYREDPAPGAAAPVPPAAPEDEDAAEVFKADPVLLFRYSALTFNGHRIHYDRDYAREVEGYGGLVVHGPLIAQMMLAFGEKTWGPAATFTFRAVSPAFDFEEIAICGRACAEGGALWARGPDGRLVMSGAMTTEGTTERTMERATPGASVARDAAR